MLMALDHYMYKKGGLEVKKAQMGIHVFWMFPGLATQHAKLKKGTHAKNPQPSLESVLEGGGCGGGEHECSVAEQGSVRRRLYLNGLLYWAVIVV